MRLLYCLFTVFVTTSSLFAQSYPAYIYLSNNSPACDGQNFLINVGYPTPPAGTTNTFRWRGPNGFTSDALESLQIPASAATTGVYSVTMTYSGTNNGTVTASTTLTVGTPKPLALVISTINGHTSWTSDKSICESPTGLSLVAYPDQAFSTNSAVYWWTGPNNFTSNEQSPNVPNAVVGLYLVEATYPNSCGIGKDTVTITPFSPSINVGSYTPGPYQQYSTSFCPGTSAEIKANTPDLPPGVTVSYQWNGPNGFTSSAQSFTLSNLTSNSAGTYSLIATYSGSCSGTAIASQSISVGPPSIGLAPFTLDKNGVNKLYSASFCEGSNVSFEVFTYREPVSYRWSGPNSYTSTIRNPTLANCTLSMSGVYSLTGTFSDGCIGTATVNVAVGTPTIRVRSYISNLEQFETTSFCPGNNVVLSVSPSTEATASYRWTGPNGFTSTAQSFTLTNVSADMSGTYSVNATFSGSCSGTSTTFRSITVGVPILSAYSIVGNSGIGQQNNTFCLGVDFEVGLSSSGVPQTYLWAGPNGFTSNTSTTKLTKATAAMSGAYSVTVTFPGGCSNTAVSNVTIGTPDVFAYSRTVGSQVSTAYSYCFGSSFELVSGNNVGAQATYKWSGPNGFTSSTQYATLTNVTSEMAGIYSVTATFSGACSGTSTALQTIQIGKPKMGLFSRSVDKLSHDNIYCPGTAFEVYPIFYTSLSSRSYVNYEWSGPNGFRSTIERSTVPTTSTLASGVYNLTATVTGECAGIYTSSELITVGKPLTFISENPIQGFASENEVYCAGASLNLYAYTIPSNADASYKWRGPNGFSSSAQSLTLTNLSSAMAGIYSVTATYSGQCVGQRVAFGNIQVGIPKMSIGLFKPNGAGGNSTRPLCTENVYKLSPFAFSLNSNDPLTNNNYEWRLPDGTTTSSPSLTITNANQTNAGRYILTTTYGGVCTGTSRDTMDITVGIPTPTLRADRNFIAAGRSAVLSADNCPGEVTWSDGQTGTSITAKPTQTTAYTAYCTFDGCSSQFSAPLTITVSNQPEVDLSLQMSVSNRTPRVNQPVTVELTVSNTSAQAANNIQVTTRLPNSLVGSSPSSSTGWSLQLNGSVLTATMTTIPANSSRTYKFIATPISSGTFRIASQITSCDNPDLDSAPNSGTNDGQDDASWIDLRTQEINQLVNQSPEPNPALLPSANFELVDLPIGTVDLSLAMSISNPVPRFNEIVTITLLLDNYCSHRILSPELSCQLPTGLTFVDGTNWSASGQIVRLPAGNYYQQWPKTFSFRAQVTGPINEAVKARISQSDWDDVDSTPTNGFDTGEDDTAQVSLRVSQ